MYDPFKQFSSLALAKILEEMSLDLGSVFFCTTTVLITEGKEKPWKLICPLCCKELGAQPRLVGKG